MMLRETLGFGLHPTNSCKTYSSSFPTPPNHLDVLLSQRNAHSSWINTIRRQQGSIESHDLISDRGRLWHFFAERLDTSRQAIYLVRSLLVCRIGLWAQQTLRQERDQFLNGSEL